MGQGGRWRVGKEERMFNVQYPIFNDQGFED
jgi:hypothetical protein